MRLLSLLDAETPPLITAYDPSGAVPIPFFGSAVPAGFPSPAEDHIDRVLDLNDLVIRHPAATFFVRVEGDSMIGAGIHSGDVLVVDRALEPGNGRVVVAVVGGAFTVKRIRKVRGRLFLVPDNPDLDPLEVSPEAGLEVWGVVTYVIHRVR